VKILLVEDDQQTADYIAKGLREHGHVIDRADNGRDDRGHEDQILAPVGHASSNRVATRFPE